MNSAPGSLMRADMEEQPQVLATIAGERRDTIARVRALVPSRLRGVVLLARGSSDHAALYGRYLIELLTGLPVSLAAPSLYTRYGVRPRLEDHLSVAVSQSGRTPEIVDVLGQMRAAGAATVAITADPAAPIASAADELLVLPTGTERAIPATKTFTAQLAAFAVLADALGTASEPDVEWEKLVDTVDGVLADSSAVKPAVELMAEADSVAHVARGITYAVAPEGALKMIEATGRAAAGFSSADFLHGPIAMAGGALAVVCYGWPGPVLSDVAEAAERAEDLGGYVITVAPRSARLTGQVRVPVHEPLSERLAAIPLAVRAQQLAHGLALALAKDPDEPPGLRKVTATT